MPAIGVNVARQKLARNELVLSMGVNQMRTPNVAVIASACGFDAIYIDLEHNPTSLETAAQICVAALGFGVTPIVRVGSHDPHVMTRALDCGAQGLIVPHVENAAEARAMVEACRFAPLGHRSAAGTVPSLGYAPLKQADVNRLLNENTLLIAMLETATAIADVEAIAATDGIDVVHIGSTDLANDMEIPGDYKHDRMRAAYKATAAATRKHRKAMGVGGIKGDLGFQTWLLGLGTRYLSTGTDVSYILSSGRADVLERRAIPLTPRPAQAP